MEGTSSQASSLRLSNNALVERLLSDIPFFSVGVMAFAVFTFFLLTKRSNLLATYLYSSALLAFIASIFDLGQLLARGGSQSILNDTSSFHGLIIGREVVLSLSVGFRMIFIWGCVAGEPSFKRFSAVGADQESLSSFQIDPITSSWEVLGISGALIKWSLLLIITAIPVLQIVWRLTSSMHHHGPLYVTESSLEISVLVGFALKLLLNVYLASSSTSWTTSLLSYTALFLAIALGLTLAIGNLLSFCFSETTLGRFLQAVELYILILWVMIIAFRPVEQKPLRARPRSSFQSHPEKGPHPPDVRLNISYPMPLSGNKNSFLYIPEAHSNSDSTRPLASTSRALPGSESRRIWSSDGSIHPFGNAAEMSNVEHVHTSPVSLSAVMGSKTDHAKLKDIDSTQQLASSSRAGTPKPMNPFISESPETNVQEEHDGSSENLLTEPSLSYYEGSSPLPSPPSNVLAYHATRDREAESPVYSLHGIIRTSKGPTKSHNSRRNSDRFSALLREHREMDKTISKLLSMQGSWQSVHSPLKASSISGQSEFSLSNFPSPPKDPLPPESHVKLKLNKRLSSGTQQYRRLSGQNVPASVIHSRDDSLDVPNGNFRLGSQGTQYDVTSFIGAGIPSNGTSTPVRKPGLSDIESGDDSSPKAPSHANGHEHSQRTSGVLNGNSDSLLLSGLAESQMGRVSPQPQLKPLYLNRTLAPGSPRPGVPRLSALNNSRTPTRVQVRPSAHRPRSLILSATVDSPGQNAQGRLFSPPSKLRTMRNHGGF